MTKSKALTTLDGQIIDILHADNYTFLEIVLKNNRNITDLKFFDPSLSDLHDPYLMPDMEKAVERIIEAKNKKERVIIFGDYDVDGVSSTAILVRFFREIGIEVSFRLPHRVHDGYGLKNYFFTELAEKNVSLVITVDCGTRDIEPIRYAKTLGIDVIVTDHHAVPEIIPEEVIALLNPKRKDSLYPFPSLAGAGVAFKLLHGILQKISENKENENEVLMKYIDFASLGTVADCMPLIGENRTITALWLKQMKKSESSALRKYIENLDKEPDGDADIIGFQIGPRINAAGRMDSPLKALHWLLATEDRVDDWLLEVENLNAKRQEEVKKYTEDALMNVDTSLPILFYTHDQIEHGLIGLVAGRLTEAYGKPAIVLCKQHEPKARAIPNREYEKNIENIPKEELHSFLVASCRSPEWCNLVELLDTCKEYFARYGWHRQAAGFTIEQSRLEEFKSTIEERFSERYDRNNLPKKTLKVECILQPQDASITTLNLIDRFRPFGIGNMKPLFLLENLTIKEVRILWKEANHLSIIFLEIPNIKCLLWNFHEIFEKGAWKIPTPGDIISPIASLDRNIWNGRESVQIMIKNILL